MARGLALAPSGGGINLISYPGAQVPASAATASALLGLTTSGRFVTRVEPGRGYLVVAGQAETLALPAR